MFANSRDASWRALHDETMRLYGMAGEHFVACWEAGAFPADDAIHYNPVIAHLVEAILRQRDFTPMNWVRFEDAANR